MNEQLWRLAWALPLVIAIGVGLILWLKRLGLGQGAAAEPEQPVLRSQTKLSDQTSVLVVDVGSQTYVVFESQAHIAVQAQGAERGLPVRHPFMTAGSVAFPWRQPGRKP